MTTLISRVLPLATLVVLTACDRNGSTASAAASSAASAGETNPPSSNPAKGPVAAASTVRTATPPADACGWISATDVSKIVGPLVGTPYSTDDGCVYPLPVPSEIARQRAEALELRRKIEEKFGKSDDVAPTPDTSAVIVEVRTYTAPAMGRGIAASFAKMGQMMCDDSASRSMPWCQAAARDTAPPPILPGWDRNNGPKSESFFGGVGHIAVNVKVQAAAVTREQTVAIANRIRESIPDLPFPATRPSNVAGPDPCILLSVNEVESVLGKLVVPPYRSDEETPLAMEQGKSCSYYTAGHHALVLTPTWEYGGMAFDAMKGIGGMIERVAPGLHNNAADTLDTGPWEDAAGDPSTGELYFLKGDRLIQLGYSVSSTDFDGAVRLARIAVGRL
jgi:hypothetical protein